MANPSNIPITTPSTRPRGSSRPLMLGLLAAALIPLASARRVRGQQGRQLDDVKKLNLELFQRDQNSGFPGAVFHEEGDGAEEFEAYAWNRMGKGKGEKFPTASPAPSGENDWVWKTKVKKYKSIKSPSCKSTKKSTKKSSPTASPAPSESPAPSLSLSPSEGPTVSLQPSVSGAPSDGPSISSVPSSEPSTGPTGEPSLSAAPTTTPMPTNKGKGTGKGGSNKTPGPSTPSVSAGPTNTAVPTKSGKGKGKGSSSSSSKSARCSPTSSPAPTITAGPTVESAPSISPGPTTTAPPTPDPTTTKTSKDDSWDIAEPNVQFCELIEELPKPQTAPDGLDEKTYSIKIPIEYNNAVLNSANVQTLLNDFISIPVALWVAGCETLAMTYLARRLALLRSLMNDGTVGYAEFENWLLATDSCTADDGGTCEKFESDLAIHIDGDISDSALKKRIQEAFEVFQSLLLKQDGITSFDVSKMAIEETSDDGTNKAIDGNNAIKDDVNAGLVVGAAAGGLAFILLLILLIRRRNGEDELSHLKLEDEGDDTFIREFATDSDPDSPRNIHVVGEADSLVSGWTGYTKDGPNDDLNLSGANAPGKLGHSKGDVHVCSSATCEVCERRRQQGVQFIPTGTPPRPQMPSDASREYVSEDTVEL